jgi:DNA-binding response OmpR family regulator
VSQVPRKVLVVEDDKNINEVVTEYLKDSGFKVESAGDGQTAKEIIERWDEIDLFILDIMLPRVSGLELLKIIRAEERFKKTPVIILTALADEYTQLVSFDGLADDYVIKPFSAKILVKRAQALLRRSGAMAGCLRAGGVEIAPDSYEAYENETRVQLTPREFELLKVFMNNPKTVLSRQQILNLAWGYNFFGDERIVDAHIKNLRKKFKTDLITTVKGVGYRLEGGEGGV